MNEGTTPPVRPAVPPPVRTPALPRRGNTLEQLRKEYETLADRVSKAAAAGDTPELEKLRPMKRAAAAAMTEAEAVERRAMKAKSKAELVRNPLTN